MGKAKTSSLLDEIATLPDGERGKPKWYEKIAKSQPEFFADVISIIQKHEAGDELLLRKFPSSRQLTDWLIKAFGRNGVVCSQTSVYHFIRWVRNGSQ